MKRRLRALGIIFLAGVWTLAAVKVEDKEEGMPVFSMSDKGETRIQVRAGDVFSLRFLTSPGTGYSWILAAPLDDRLLAITEKKNEPSPSGLLGASEYETWIFRALDAGRTEIVVKYARLWEKDAAPLKKHVFKVLCQ